MIDFRLSSTQRELVAATRSAAKQLFPISECTTAISARTALHPAPDRWRRAAALGWFSAALHDDSSGARFGLAEQALVFIELGRALVTGPLIGTALATAVSGRSGRPDLAEQFATGDVQAGVLAGDYAVDAVAAQYGIRITAEGAELCEIAEATPVVSIDEATAIAAVQSTVPRLQIADTHVQHHLHVLLGSYLVGMAELATEMSSGYAKLRQQFGKPIGTYQAVKHRCAEMAIRAHAARAQVLMAAMVADPRHGGDGALESAAGYHLSLEAAQRNADDNIQNHGGIGVTAEHEAGALAKRVQIYCRMGAPRSRLVSTLLTAPASQVD